MKRVLLDTPLSVAQVDAVAQGARVEIAPEAVERARRSREALERLEESGEVIYGVNTGFGPLKSEVIPPGDRVKLQENLIRSHAVGIGEPLRREEVRAAMLLLAATHLRGHSGVGPEAAQRICELLNADIIPVVPSRGSLGSSGDLAPLSHVARALIGDDVPVYGGKKDRGEPLRATSKLGLSLINGTHFHTAIAALQVAKAETMAKAADIACASNLEATLCSDKPFRADVHALRPHPNQAKSARNVSRLIEGSGLIMSHQGCHEVQDAYSLRCAPQVHGAARQAVSHLRGVVEIELGSVTDNPLVIGDEVVSAGHFHGEPVGLALDYFKIGVAELAAISERRTERSLNKDSSRGLPAFLVPRAGLNSGMMMLQYTAASLVSENKVLCHPACVDSITTGAGQEDHNSMAMTAALHARQVAESAYTVLAIELLVGAQALDCRRAIQPDKPGKGVQAAWDAVRAQSAHLDEDRPLADEVASLQLENVIAAVEAAVGEME